jgi:hypothetical protein
MATGLEIDVTTGQQSRRFVPPRPPSPLAVAEHQRAMALERLRQRAKVVDDLGSVVDALLTLMGYQDG